MTEKVEEKKDANPMRLFGMVLSSLPSLMFKFGGIYLRFKRDAKKGGHIFQKELIRQGLDKETATELTQIYVEGSDLFKSLMNLR